MTIREIRDTLDKKEATVTEITQRYLDRINETNEALNSFITVTDEHALHRAEHAQKEIDNGNASVLTGVPYAAKDLFCTKGIRTTAASNILNEYVPPYTATSVHKLGDSVLLGKTNLDEFAQGASNEYSAYGPVKNPYNLDHVPGGSSGGSAASVASGQAPYAIATDTAGSVRQPAGMCGVVGLKPTYGRISRYGVVAMASSLDTVGFMTNTVEDSAILLQEMAGADALDATTPDVAVDNYLEGLDAGIAGKIVGVPKEYMELEGLTPEMRVIAEETLKRLEGLGAKLAEVSMPHTKYTLPCYYVLCPSEVSSNMAKYDGIQYGKPAEGAKTLDEVYMMTRDQGFGPEVKRRIMLGTFALSSGYYDAYFKKALQVRTLIIEDFSEAFKQVDLLFAPTSPYPAFKFGEKNNDPVAMYAADAYTVPASLSGVPGISIPSGHINGLPVGMQLFSPQFKEKELLQAAHALESVTTVDGLTLAV